MRRLSIMLSQLAGPYSVKEKGISSRLMRKGCFFVRALSLKVGRWSATAAEDEAAARLGGRVALDQKAETWRFWCQTRRKEKLCKTRRIRPEGLARKKT
jgi:hypothetical protein